MSNQWKITAIRQSEEQTLMVIFTDFWDQEDIADLQTQLLSVLEDGEQSFRLIERTLGADREYSRFLLAGNEYSINFECYSQSCWFEVQPPADESALTLMQELLTQKLGVNENT